MSSLDAWPAGYAERLLAPLGVRWQHVRGVAACAAALSKRLSPDDGRVLIAAAFLHDIGYVPALRRTGFHPLDGARHLREMGEERLACLVAYHSAAKIEAEAYGLGQALAEFPDEHSVVSLALTYCDMTVGKDGKPVTTAARLADIETRYGRQGTVAKAAKSAAKAARRFEGLKAEAHSADKPT